MSAQSRILVQEIDFFASDVFAADMDVDGDIDLVTCNRSLYTIAWYENDGNENFAEHMIATDINFPNDIYIEDVDGDGDMDVLSAIKIEDKIMWFESGKY